MKKRTLFSILTLVLVAVFAFSLTACSKKVDTLELLQNEYGIVVDGGSFEKGTTLISNEILATAEEAAKVLEAIADQDYNKESKVHIFDIFAEKDGVKVQPDGKVQVSIPVPNAEVVDYLVFHVKDNGLVEKIIPTLLDGKITFETSSFSYFVIVEVAPEEPECIEHTFGTDGKCTVCGSECVHTEVVDEAVAPTCTEAGKTEGKHCSVCKTVLVKQEEVGATGHTYEWVEGKEPTCEEEGEVAHYHCEVCGKNFNPNYGEIKSVTIPKGAHEYGAMYYANTPNFFYDGNIAYYQCATCEKYFDEEYNEIETVVVPKYSTNLSICVNGTPTALVLGEQHENFIEWSLEGLSITKGDVITLCQTDNVEITHNYFADGNVGTDGKILTTSEEAGVLLTATPNGLMLFIDGYKYEGIVIEINGVQYPMNFVTYPDGETISYVYGYVNFAVGDKFVVVDNVSGTVYDRDDLAEELLWDTWDFHRGDNGEFVIDCAARYGIEFDYNGDKKVYVTKAFAPYDGESFGMVFEGEREDEMLAGLELPVDDSADNEFMWTLTHCTTMNNTDYVEYIGENGLWFYYTIINLEAGEKFHLKNFTTGEFIGADHLVDITGDITAVTREGDLVSVQKSGSFYVIYLPVFNSFTIDCDTSDPLATIYVLADNEELTLIPDENGEVSYNGLNVTASTCITIFDARYSPLPIVLDEAMDGSLVNVTVYEDYYYAYTNKAGTCNFKYNVYTNVFYLEYVGGEEGGGDTEFDPSNYLYYLSVSGGSGSTQTLTMQANPTNTKEVCYKGVQLTASCFIGVIEMAKDASSSNTYGAIADTDSSIAQSYGTVAMVKIAGMYDVYFDTEAKTIRIVAVVSECEKNGCVYDNGIVTQNPTHLEAGVKTYTCTVCERTKTEPVPKTTEHSFGNWTPDAENAGKHIRECKCGETEKGDCTFDNGVVTQNPTHLEAGVKTYTCTVCKRTKTEPVPKTADHEFGNWTPDRENENKHDRECACGETETGDCTFDNGVVTQNPTHLEAGVKTYTCTVCGRTKTDSIEKTSEHNFGKWMPDEVDEEKHYRECACGEAETAACTFDENGICTACGREKSEEADGIIIVIAGGTATFEGKEATVAYSNIYGENATVYIAQANDVLNVTLNDQAGRTLKYWMSAAGTVIPDEDFSILVFRSGYYYPVFEDTDANDFSGREKIFEGNCEEGILYMSTNSKGDIKYEVEYVNYGHHAFAETVDHNSRYHKQVCSLCGETVFEEHTECDREIEKEAGHTEEGLMRCECFCGHVWMQAIPITDEHTIDYDDWHIVEESKNGQYGKYRVYCKYCDYYEEYWYLGGFDFISFIDGKMINYQYTYGGKVSHDEYYYSYRNAEGKKIYIWALQYEYEYSSNEDYNDTFIFMYVDDEDPTTIEPIYLSKSKGDRRSEYLWAIYGYAYDVNGWIETLDDPDDNMGCSDGMLLGNSMSARASVLEAYHDYWAETYNELRIPTSKAYDDLSGTPWEIDWEGKSWQGDYYDENGESVTTGGRDTIRFVKNPEESYKKYMHVDKATGITYGYEDFGTYYRTVFIMRTYKTIVSPEEFEKLDAAGKSLHYSYGDIEKDVKSLCAKRNVFNNFTLTLPETIGAFRFIFSDPADCVEISGEDTNVYYNTSHVYDSGSPITLSWNGKEGLVFDRYEIWDFANQTWVVLSESPEFTFNTLDNPRRDAAYVRVICHEVDVPVEPGETFRITVENGYFEIDGEIYRDTVEVPANTFVYVYADEVEGKTFEHWLNSNNEEFDGYYFYVTSDTVLKPVYTDTIYGVYCEGWNYDAYISINGGENHYTDKFEGKAGDTVELSTSAIPDGECTVFLGWYLETYGQDGPEYILISDSQTFTYQITGEEDGFLYAVWTTGENPFVKKFVDIRATNGFVSYAGGEASENFDNAYSAISLSNMGRVTFFDDPTDETVYTTWDIAYRYELEGEVQHEIAESYEDEYGYYPAEYWVNDPQYSYPDGEINVTGIDASSEDFEGEI